EHADLAVAVVRGHEQLAAAAHHADLRVGQGRPVEIALLRLRSQARPAGGNPVETPDVLDLAACEVPPPGAGQVEDASGIEGEGRDRGAAARAALLARIEPLSRHVDLDAEAGRDLELGRCDGGRERRGHRKEPTRPPRGAPARYRASAAVVLPRAR